MKSIYCLAVGTFAIGTESLMIVPLLPRMSTDLHVPLVDVGMLVTVFTLTLAISSPILTTMLGNFNRRKVLIFALSAFAVANIIAYASTNYWELLLARILLALSAGLYNPNANAIAGVIVPPEKRGKAISIVNSGSAVAVAFGLPLGSLVGQSFGWRFMFLGVCLITILAVLGVTIALHSSVGDHIKGASFKDRVTMAGRRDVLTELFVMLAWAVGAYTVWTYIAPYLSQSIGADDNEISATIFLFGIAAATGMILGGYLNDRYGHRATVIPLLTISILALLGLSASALFLDQHQTTVPAFTFIFLWGVATWGFYPCQVTRLIGLAGSAQAAVVLSLNTSFMYIGFAIGAFVGSVVLLDGVVADLGWVGATFYAVALLLFLSARGSKGANTVTRTP
ncbi:MFS transporter [Rhizobium mayense]|uniref:MFS transporter n=1 Tax=Rhizobium mayense TaxID=1312184 RepID=A0ABT7K6D4_9HYPH|nr:MFS transporter [Rhizobium mayense]MDL2403727.1 MFS transporter [Rhizobium mayense]